MWVCQVRCDEVIMVSVTSVMKSVVLFTKSVRGMSGVWTAYRGRHWPESEPGWEGKFVKSLLDVGQAALLALFQTTQP
jgi:hypothetical protein